MTPAGLTITEQADLRGFMATFPTGVGIVTGLAEDGQPRGMTCTSLCSVSLVPPIVLVCLREGSPTLESVLARKSFALNLIGEASQATAQLFASGRRDRFNQVRWHLDASAAGPHLPYDAHAIADCRVVRADPVGDHTVVFGEVSRTRLLAEPNPLLYGCRRYERWSR